MNNQMLDKVYKTTELKLFRTVLILIIL